MTGSGSLPHRRPGARRQGRAPARPVRRALGRDPWLIVPNRADVERVERELVERRGGLLAGTVGTFDTLFGELARADGEGKRLLGDAERAVVLRRLVDAAQAHGPRLAGLADAVGRALAELDGSLLDADDLPDRLAPLAHAYRAELAALDAWDRGSLRRRAVERLTTELERGARARSSRTASRI